MKDRVGEREKATVQMIFKLIIFTLTTTTRITKFK